MAQREVGEIDRAKNEWDPNLQFGVEATSREDLGFGHSVNWGEFKGVPAETFGGCPLVEWCGEHDWDTSRQLYAQSSYGSHPVAYGHGDPKSF
jgi:hypothetical protein